MEECLWAQRTGLLLMNIEQDLGIPGLRFAKLGERPCGFLRKFTVRAA